MSQTGDPLKDAFMELAIQDLQGVGAKPRVGTSSEVSVVESRLPDKDAFARAALQDLGIKPTVSVIKEVRSVRLEPVEEPKEKIVEQFMAEASQETAEVLKKLLKGIR